MSIISVLVGMGAGSFKFNATISANVANYNLRAAAVAAGWNQVSPLDATVTINSGIYVISTSTSTPAFATGSTFPTKTTLKLVNNGLIYGVSGLGGPGGIMPTGSGSAGGVGGPALTASYAISITNNGVIGGGGGGGNGLTATSGANGASGGRGAGAVSLVTQYATGQASAGGVTAGGNLGSSGGGGVAGGVCTTSGSNAFITWAATGTRAGSLL